MAAGAIVPVAAGLAGPGARLGVAFAAIVLAVFLAAWARRIEAEHGRDSGPWALAAGFAIGLAGAAGHAHAGSWWRGLLLTVGGVMLVAVVLGRAPERERRSGA